VPPHVSTELTRIGRKTGATYFMTRLAAFAAQLAIESGEDDVIVGTYATTRRLAETQTMFGFFSNLMTLRLRFAPELSFEQWLERVRDTVLEASARSEIPYGMLSEELAREGAPPPAIRAIFSGGDPLVPASFGGLEVTSLRRTFESMPWSFSCVTSPWDEADGCRAAFDARLCDPEGVRAFIGGLGRLLETVAAAPQRALQELPNAPDAPRIPA
jgi:non-ribosomal peptide synthetase component F